MTVDNIIIASCAQSDYPITLRTSPSKLLYEIHPATWLGILYTRSCHTGE